jgi:hypothetical protein
MKRLSLNYHKIHLEYRLFKDGKFLMTIENED